MHFVVHIWTISNLLRRLRRNTWSESHMACIYWYMILLSRCSYLLHVRKLVHCMVRHLKKNDIWRKWIPVCFVVSSSVIMADFLILKTQQTIIITMFFHSVYFLKVLVEWINFSSFCSSFYVSYSQLSSWARTCILLCLLHRIESIFVNFVCALVSHTCYIRS